MWTGWEEGFMARLDRTGMVGWIGSVLECVTMNTLREDEGKGCV